MYSRFAARSPAEKREYIRRCRPGGLSVAEGCRLMGLARSTYYDEIKGQPIEEGRLMTHITEKSVPSSRGTATDA